jgi:hypothetical protein
MHVSHLKPLPLQPATPVEPVMRKKRDEDQDHVTRDEDKAKEERRRRQAWLEASLEKLDEEDQPGPDETYQATSAPSSLDEASTPAKAAAPPPEVHSPLDDLLAGIKAEPATEHAEVVIEPKPSLDELLTIIREHPEER